MVLITTPANRNKVLLRRRGVLFVDYSALSPLGLLLDDIQRYLVDQVRCIRIQTELLRRIIFKQLRLLEDIRLSPLVVQVPDQSSKVALWSKPTVCISASIPNPL